MKQLIHYSFRVWQRNLDVLLMVWKAELAGAMVEPIVVLLVMGYGLGALVGNVQGVKYIQFIGPGIIAGYAMYGATFECTYGSFTRMQIQKTYDAIIATPVNIQDVIVGEIFWAATRSLITSSSVLLATYLLGIISSPWALLIIPVSFLAGLMFASIALLYTSFSPSYYSFNFFFTLFITPMYFFSGIYFPLTNFPPIVQGLSWLAPLKPVADLTRALANGQWHNELFISLTVIILITLTFFFLTIIFMKKRLIK
ncbi:MAG: ABC transporter permease [bacterium]|nr:ABC transporter permease [bacterium]